MLDYRNGKKRLFMGIFKGSDKYRKTLQVNMVEKGKLKCDTEVLIYAAQDQALRTKSVKYGIGKTQVSSLWTHFTPLF